MSRVSFYTLGCKLNFAESSTIARQFQERGFQVVPYGEAADVTVINTCTVTQEAERKCRQSIRRAQKVSPDAFIVVTGCYAQLEPERIAAIPGVDAVLGTAQKFSLFDVVPDFQKREMTQVEVSCIDEATSYGPAYSTGERTRAFLKVQDGCDYSCSFCTIPLARGASRSQPIADCLDQARDLADRGFREIVLSGVNIGLFGAAHGERLIDLLRALDRVDGVLRYRISSIEPNLLTEEIIDFVGSSQRFQPHFHIPLQSGDDFVLGKMRRRYKRSLYRDRVESIRRVLPDASVGVDVIVGFPFESASHFDNTTAFIADLPVSYLHVFTYSDRPGAPLNRERGRPEADRVPSDERARRNRVLRSLSSRKQRSFYGEHMGSERVVLWETPDDFGRQLGFTDNYIRVVRDADDRREGVTELVRLGDFAAPGLLTAEDTDSIALPVI